MKDESRRRNQEGHPEGFSSFILHPSSFILGLWPSLAEDDFRSDATVGENLQEKRVSESPVDDVRLLDAGLQRVETGFDLGDHAAVDDTPRHQGAATGSVQVRDE